MFGDYSFIFIERFLLRQNKQKIVLRQNAKTILGHAGGILLYIFLIFSSQNYVGEVSVGEVSVGEVSVGEVSVGEVSIGEVAGGEVSVGEMSVGDLSVRESVTNASENNRSFGF